MPVPLIYVAIGSFVAKSSMKKKPSPKKVKEDNKTIKKSCQGSSIQECPGDSGIIGGKKSPLKKGEVDEYGNLKKQTGDGTIHRDHQPSKAALLKRAKELKGGPLSKEEKARIINTGDAANVPVDIHKAGPTYGRKNSAAQQSSDAGDLSSAAARDADAMVKNAKKLDPDNISVYEKAASKIKNKDNAAYDKMLKNQLE